MSDSVKSLGEFWDDLNHHDWFHMMSDSGAVDKRGSAEASRLRGISHQSPEHEALMEAFRKSVWEGTDRPERPEK